MRSRSNTSFICVLLAAGCVFSAVARADLRVVGSDLLGLDFTRAFYEFAGRKAVRLALAFDGSRSGLAALAAGRADLALAVVPPREMATLAEYRSMPIGYHGVVVLVAAACPVEQISLEKLALLFGAGAATGAPARWRDLGATDDWAGGMVIALAPEVGAGIALEYFRQAVLGGGELRANVRRFADAKSLAAELSGEGRALALAAAIPAGEPGLKVLRVAAAAKSPAYAPTIEHLHSGDYPLRLPLQLVFKPARLAALAPVMEFLLSDEAARLLARVDLVPLPAPARADAYRGLMGGGR